MATKIDYKFEVEKQIEEDPRFKTYQDMISKHLKKRAVVARDLINLDAEVNGGALVQVATILGKPLYVRVNHKDMEKAQYELNEIRSIVKDVVIGNDEDNASQA